MIDEVQSSPTPIILFIDEIHPDRRRRRLWYRRRRQPVETALARGQLRTLGATTVGIQEIHREGSGALTRRFRVVQVHEPSEDKALLMLRSTVSPLEQHHRRAAAG
ncbi:hypothetical protein M8494_06115 [Serratia ureilytica]